MKDDLERIIVRALKRSKVLIRKKGEDPDTGYRVVARGVREELELSYELRRRSLRIGHSIGWKEER